MGIDRLFVMLAILGCGCARDATAAHAGSPNERVVCHMEKVVGSHMKQEVCESEIDRRNNREGAQSALRSPKTEVVPIE